MMGKTVRKRAIIGLSAGLFILCTLYYRQFRKVVRIRTSAAHLFRPKYRLSFGYFLAKRAADMQNQTVSENHMLAPDAIRGLLLGKNWTPHDWTHSWNIQPTSPVYRFNLKADLEGMAITRSVSMERIEGGMKTVESNQAFSFLPDPAARPGEGDPPNLRSAATLIEFSIDVLKRVYGITDGDLMTVTPDVVNNVPYFSTGVYSPPLRFDSTTASTAPIKRLKQSAAFSTRAFRNYYSNGNYHEVYLQVDPLPGNAQVLESLGAELDRATIDSVSVQARSRINCLAITAQGDGAAARKFVRASECRARIDIRLKDGQISRIHSEFTEEPLGVLTWVCSGAKSAQRCRPAESSTSIQALELAGE